MIDGDSIIWPGIDRDRAVAAAWHLERALRRLAAFHRSGVPAHTVTGRRLLHQADEHSRIARGYLGAVGFERKARL